jgi:hypothetical protein
MTAEGAGKFEWSNGDSYEGEWAVDMMEGRGRIQYSNGNVYTGRLTSNVKQGFGSFVPRSSAHRGSTCSVCFLVDAVVGVDDG